MKKKPIENTYRRKNVKNDVGVVFTSIRRFATLSNRRFRRRRRWKISTHPSGINFNNVLLAAFMLSDPKNVKIILIFNWIVTLLGSVWVRAALRMLIKLTPARKHVGETDSKPANSKSSLYLKDDLNLLKRKKTI